MKKILLIEDNNQIREESAVLLSLEGYEVLEANNGIAGLELAKSIKPDLILCDVLMPGLNGFEVLLNLRKSPDNYTTCFIFLTALSSDEFVQNISENHHHDFTAYLRKPYEASELLGLIKALLAA